MGYHGCAIGYTLDGRLLKIFKLCCRSVTYKGKKYNMKNKFDRKLFKEVIDYYNNDFMEEWEILTLPELKVVDTYDDILIHDNKFLYKHDKNVYIECATTCHYMIYVLSGEKCDDSCSDETMMNLIQWKKQLVQQERISEQSLQLVVDI